MTYGEYYYLIKYDMKLIDGVWVSKKPSVTIPTRMPKRDASAYYRKKFNRYWETLEK